jgi:hypothetical protein
MTSSADGQVLGTPSSFPFAGTAVAVEFDGLLLDGLDVDVAVVAADGVVVDPLEQAVADTATSTSPVQVMRTAIRMASPRFRRGSVAGHWAKAIRRP